MIVLATWDIRLMVEGIPRCGQILSKLGMKHHSPIYLFHILLFIPQFSMTHNSICTVIWIACACINSFILQRTFGIEVMWYLFRIVIINKFQLFPLHHQLLPFRPSLICDSCPFLNLTSYTLKVLLTIVSRRVDFHSTSRLLAKYFLWLTFWEGSMPFETARPSVSCERMPAQTSCVSRILLQLPGVELLHGPAAPTFLWLPLSFPQKEDQG